MVIFRMEVSAKLKGARIAAQKARLVADQIRGESVESALEILQFSKKKAAAIFKKLLESAIANAEHNNGLSIDQLIVKNAIIDGGPTMKRYRPRARGSASPIHKKTSHITVILSDN